MALPASVQRLGSFKGDKGRPGTFDTASAVSVPAGSPATATISGPEGEHVTFEVPRGLPGVNAVANDEATATLLGMLDSLTGVAFADRLTALLGDSLSNAYRAYFTQVEQKSGRVFVDNYKTATNTDREAIIAAVNDALARSIRGVHFAARRYNLEEAITLPPMNGFSFQGVPGGTVIGRGTPGVTSAGFILRSTTGGKFIDVSFDGLTFDGGANNIHLLGDARVRNTGEPGGTDNSTIQYTNVLHYAILTDGAFAKYVNSAGDYPNPYGEVRNISVTNCKFIGMRGLPVFFKGVHGFARIESCYFERCLDPGFTYTESAKFVNNVSRFGQDNGVSISRGVKHAVVTGNHIHGANMNGIWIAGWTEAVATAPGFSLKSGPGPEVATVTGNTVTFAGYFGVNATDNDGTLTISGNTIYDTNSSVANSTERGVGIVVASSAAGFGNSVTISGNTIDLADRGGITVRGFRAMSITDNTIRNAGTEFLRDGTVRPNTTGLQKFGITSGQAANKLLADTLIITNNLIVNTRGGTANARYGIYYPLAVTTATTWLVSNNLVRGYETDQQLT